MWNRKSPSGESNENTAQAGMAKPSKGGSLSERSESMDAIAMIGKSIVIKGELSGAEDLVVEGVVEGKINLPKNNLTVGAEGRVNADVSAQVVTITGKVEGDVTATERVEITASGAVTGNVRTPRLVVADGAFFQGSIEMKKAETADKASVVTLKPAGVATVKVAAGTA